MNQSVPRTIAGLVGLAFAQAAGAAADLTGLGLEKLLEMRVIAASSYEQAVAEAPSAVTVITAEDIRTRGYRTIADALRAVPGLYVTDDQSYVYVGSRGFNRIGDYNSRFQLSVNGLRTNDALFDMAYLGTDFPLDMALVERIEFAPGPGSSIYGSNAMLGVINIVTRTGSGLSGPRVASAIGTNQMRELAVSFGQRYASGLEVLASVSGLQDDGQSYYFPQFDTPATNDGIAAGQNGERYRRGYLRATYGGFDVEAFGGRREKASPGVYFGGDFSDPNRITDTMGYVVLRYQREIARATHIEARVNASRYQYLGLYPAETGITNRDDATGISQAAEMRVVSSYWAGHKLVAGIEHQRDTRLDQRNADIDATYLDRHDTGRRTGLYLQDEIRLNERWLLNAGVRHDRHYTSGSSTSPRLALIGEIRPGTTLKLLHGSAFRAPNAYELYYVTGGFRSNPELGPEHIRTSEAVVEHQVGERSRWRASAFHYRFDDLIEQVVDDDGLYVFRNLGGVSSRGVEISCTTLLPGGVRADASASFHDVRTSEGERLTNSPRYTAKVALEAPIPGTAVRAAVELGAIGPRLDRDRERVSTAITSSLALTTARPWHGATFSLAIHNLLDRANGDPVSEYFAPRQVPSVGRTLRFGIEWRF